MAEDGKDIKPTFGMFELPNSRPLGNYNAGNFREKGRFGREDTVDVPMDFELVTTAQDEKPYIGTMSLASCLGIGLSDAEHGVAGVAHVFFTEKEEIVQYMHDSQGRAIPSSGRAIMVNKHNPFADTQWRLNHLVSLAKEKGAKKIKLMFFNVEGGVRTPEQNNQLQETITKSLDALRKKREEDKKELEIDDVSYRHEQAFRIDSRTGQVLPYDF